MPSLVKLEDEGAARPPQSEAPRREITPTNKERPAATKKPKKTKPKKKNQLTLNRFFAAPAAKPTPPSPNHAAILKQRKPELMEIVLGKRRATMTPLRSVEPTHDSTAVTAVSDPTETSVNQDSIVTPVAAGNAVSESGKGLGMMQVQKDTKDEAKDTTNPDSSMVDATSPKAKLSKPSMVQEVMVEEIEPDLVDTPQKVPESSDETAFDTPMDAKESSGGPEETLQKQDDSKGVTEDVDMEPKTPVQVIDSTENVGDEAAITAPVKEHESTEAATTAPDNKHESTEAATNAPDEDHESAEASLEKVPTADETSEPASGDGEESELKSTRKRKAKSKTPKLPQGNIEPPCVAGIEAEELRAKHQALLDKYLPKAVDELQACIGKLPEEDFELDVPEPTPIEQAQPIPDSCVPVLSALIEGQSDPLSKLTLTVKSRMDALYNLDFSTDAIASKIQILATRRNYIKQPGAITGTTSAKPDLYEDVTAEYLWRWEVITLDFLGDTTRVKKARAARRKRSATINALAKLLSTIANANRLMDLPNRAKFDSAIAQIGPDEEKVLKLDRANEKARLAAEAKAAKELARVQKELEKKRKVESKKEAVRLKEEAAAEKQRQKEMKKTAQDDKKRKKEEQEEKKKSAQNAQKKRMLSFFSSKPAKSKPAATAVAAPAATPKSSMDQPTKQSFNPDHFRDSIGKSTGVVDWKPCRKTRMTRKNRMITIPVYVTVYPEGEENAFVEPYAEQKNVQVSNTYKFLMFHEDVRPAYYGTWSKSSTIIKGRKPFEKDTSFLDYDVDSEAEWEEGDDEIGEDLGDNDKEDADADKAIDVGEADHDDWLAADDEVDEDLDEETRIIRKQTLANREETKKLQQVRFIGPSTTGRVGAAEGFGSPSSYLETLRASRLNQEPLCLDPFPPTLIEDTDGKTESGNEKSQTVSDDSLKIIATFVHNSTLGSKDKVVDELLSAHKAVTNSRAQALRLLDSIADKKKHPISGTYWEVKKDVLEKLGLKDLANSSVTDSKQRKAVSDLAKFIHNNTTSSKEKLLDDYRASTSSTSGNRSETMRLLQSIATKHKHPAGGYYWQVNPSVRKEHDLNDLDPAPPAKTPSLPPAPSTSPPLAVKPTGESPETVDNKSSPKKRQNPSAASIRLVQALVRKKKKTA